MKKNIKKFIKVFILGGLIFTSCGCRRDTMEDITIITANYPNEYIINKLYSDHATISSIYPDGVDPGDYELTNKQKRDFATDDLFIYTGLIEKERDLAVTFLDYNNELKIIDSSYVLENDYNTSELWNDPSFMLMMSQNVRISLKEYVENSYLRKEIDDNYEELKVEVSELDANIRLAVESAPYKAVVITDSAFRFLEKYGVTVYLLNDETSDKDISEIEQLIRNGRITKFFGYEDDKVSSAAQNIINKFPTLIEFRYFKHLNLLTEEDRETNSDYITLMTQNLDTLKEELYHGTETTS